MKALWQISWWAAFILVLACLFLSLSYTFGEALFIATLYLPGIFLLRQWIPQLPARTTAESEWDEDEGPLTRRKWLSCAGFFLALILLETLLVLLAHLLVLSPPDNPLAVTSPILLYNPVLALIILGAGYGWGLLTEWSRKRWLPEKEPAIDFVSDRQKVSVPIASILFIESRDTEVYIHLADGTAYRNKTPISRWESILGSGFLRIHRAYLVNAARIERTTPDAVFLAGQSLPLSRKYRDNVK